MEIKSKIGCIHRFYDTGIGELCACGFCVLFIFWEKCSWMRDLVFFKELVEVLFVDEAMDGIVVRRGEMVISF